MTAGINNELIKISELIKIKSVIRSTTMNNMATFKLSLFLLYIQIRIKSPSLNGSNKFAVDPNPLIAKINRCLKGAKPSRNRLVAIPRRI